MRWTSYAFGLAVALGGLVATVAVGDDSAHRMTAGGQADSLPPSYVPPLVSNGDLCMLVDYLGGQTQRRYTRMMPGILRAGRRYGPPHDRLIPFGYFVHDLAVDGKKCGEPTQWTQTLDTQAAVVTCRNDYGEDLRVETSVFVPLSRNLVVVRRRLISTAPAVRQVQTTFRYCFGPPGGANRVPQRVTSNGVWNEAAQCAEFRYVADGYPGSRGIVAVFSDQPVEATVDRQVVELTSPWAVESGKPVEWTCYLLFSDTVGGADFADRATQLRDVARQQGYEGLLAAHRKQWAAYWDESYVRLPDERLENVYRTAQYHLRSNATRWSFPVGIFNTHWAGRYFGWDEMFCYQALASSNHLDISRRCPEFRFAGLAKALRRASHYGKPGIYGARYPWETVEDGSEAAPPGFWMEHVFHMSNIALGAWSQYLYTEDAEYLKKTGYPVVRECARFFLANMVYETKDGEMFIGKCTDLERLGPAKQRPFMTTCGAIYTLEAAARAADLLDENQDEAPAWKQAAAKLRQSLPHDGHRYLPYPDCTERSVAVMGGLYPYPVFDETSELQRNAAFDFVTHGRASGNMYPVGNAVCAWYAGWMAAALAALGDTEEPVKLLSEAAEGAGCFAELFEINEAAVSKNPWFSTGAGNVVYALNQMLLQCRDDEIRIAAAVPESWNDYAFKLACYGNLVAEVAVENGRLARLTLAPGNEETECQRTLLIPSRLVDEATFDKAVVQSVSDKGANKAVAVRFKGPTEVVRRK